MSAPKIRKHNVSNSVNYFSGTLVSSNCFTDLIAGRKEEKSWTPNINILNKHTDNVAKLEYVELTVKGQYYMQRVFTGSSKERNT
jgi:hypothetical protein